MAAHLDVEQAYHLVSNASRRAMGLPQVDFQPGDPAELLAVRGRTLREVVAFAPQDRLVFHRGCLVARSTTSIEITPPA
jgi:cytosine deaminase